MTTECASQIEEMTKCVFDTMLNMPLECSDSESQDADDVLAMIQITGTFTGSVVLGLSHGAAMQSASTMLAVPLNDVSSADKRDVAAELVNMVGGNLKSLLPGPSYLSLPTVIEGPNARFEIHGAELVDGVLFASDGGPLRVQLYTRSSAN
jgi:chemotaxis protein CheX